MYRQQLSPRKTVQLLVLLTLLAWATQTFIHQWAHGEESGRDAQQPTGQGGQESQEKFVPGTTRYFAGATLELRSEATIVGGEIKLKQVCRWSEADKGAFEPIADLVLARVSENVPFRAVSLEQLKQTLHDAGVNLGVIHFAGALNCTVSRGDVPYDEHTALEQWINAKQPPATQESTAPSVGAAGAGASEAQPARFSPPPATEEAKTVTTLRDLLLANLAERLSLPVESLQVHFNPQDEKVLNLAEPQYHFNVDGQRARTLGDVAWEATIIPHEGPAKKVVVIATARAWQDQLLTAKAIAYKQIIRDQDLIARHVLVDQIDQDHPATREQVVGQMAGRELKAGTIITPRWVDPVPLAIPGQLVSVTVEQGNVEIRTVARALEIGSFGQTIRVRSEMTRDMYDIVLTGPQAGKMVSNGPAVGANIASVDRH